MEKRTSLLESGLLWFGAAVSIAEILSGTLLAPLGITKALMAIVIGHFIGGVILFLAGYMGAKTGMGAMDTVKLGFGRKGATFFAVLNMIQLVGWGAIMIFDGAMAAEAVFGKPPWVFSIGLGLLILVWILVGKKLLKYLNIIAVLTLTVLSILLGKFIMEYSGVVEFIPISTSLSFNMAIELSTIMSLSWLPVISDYTKDEEKPFAGTLVSVLVYSVISSWMYVIGLMMAVYTQESDLVDIFVKAHSGVRVLVLIVLATVTTAFMHFLSTGYSAQSVYEKLNPKATAVVVTIGAVIVSCFYSMSNIAPFLLAIGAVFTPMIGVLLVQYYIFGKREATVGLRLESFVVWLLGMIIYYYFTAMNLSFGIAIPDLLVTMFLTYFVGRLSKVAHTKY